MAERVMVMMMPVGRVMTVMEMRRRRGEMAVHDSVGGEWRSHAVTSHAAHCSSDGTVGRA